MALAGRARGLFFAPVEGRRVVAYCHGGAIGANAGALLLGAADRPIGLIERFAVCFGDGVAASGSGTMCRPSSVRGCSASRPPGSPGTVPFRDRIDGFLAIDRYADRFDYDLLRHDPPMGVVLGRLEVRHGRCAPFAGKNTLNRPEHGSSVAERYRRFVPDPAAIEPLLVSLFFDADAEPPKEIVLDLAATDDPHHGHLQGRFLHG